MDFKEFVETHTIGEIKKAYPQIKDYLDNTGLWNLPDNLTFAKAFEDIDEEDLWQVGIRDGNIADELAKYLSAMQNLENKDEVKVHKLTINGGKNKLGEAENIQVEIFAGQVISIVGPTGSGKSRLLADIECLAQEDTPTKRQILIDDEILDDEARFNLEGKLVAQLSQNMNFIMDITVEDFLTMHAKVRLGKEIENEKVIIAKCFSMANELAGEKFTLDTKVTQLSGGQSRALMIADVACISSSPIVLIDEIENAGIDRQKAGIKNDVSVIGNISIGRLFVQHSHAFQYQSVCGILGQLMQDSIAEVLLKLLLGLACAHFLRDSFKRDTRHNGASHLLERRVSN